HVIPIYQAGEESGLVFLTMRYVEGTDLAKLLAHEGALEPRRAVEILSQIAEALDAAHEKGLIHRDVKPSNILIAEAAGKEHCYLSDFGLTKRTGSLSGVSAPGDVVGTLEYVAPEQITGDPLDSRADVYSLGCVLYECLTGRSPFPRATDVALLWAHVHEEPTPPAKARPELPRELDTVLARGLAKEPGRRYRSAGELLAATRSALRLAEPAPLEKRTSRLLLAGASVLVLGVIAAVLALVLRDGSGGLSSVSPNSVGVIDPQTNKLVAEVPVGRDPQAIVTGAGGVWATNVENEFVSRIDPADAAASPNFISVGGYPSDLTIGAGSVWVALGPLAEVVRINPEQNEPASPISALGEGTPCGGPRASITFGDGFAWFVCEGGAIGKVNAVTLVATDIGLESGLVTSSSSVLAQFSDVAFGLGSLWIVNRAANQVVELDPLTNQGQREITVGQDPAAIAVGTNVLWVANFEADTVTRVDIPGPGQPAVPTTFPVGDGP
ncbi:MAG: protein kinase domain-containing protein, partial [Anaerolineales bacterium]